MIEKLKDAIYDIEHTKFFALLLVIMVGGLIALFVYAIPIYVDAETVGRNLGEKEGKAAGLAVGSYEGVTEGASAGNAAGRGEGLSVEDTEALLKSEMANTGVYEVFVADIGLNDTVAVGAGEKQTYAGLYEFAADAVYSVDLSKAKVGIEKGEAGEEEVVVSIPYPEVKLLVDERGTEKKAEWAASAKAARGKESYTGALNSSDEIKKSALEKIKNTDILKEQSREAAISQVTVLAKTICGEEAKISVKYIEGQKEDTDVDVKEEESSKKNKDASDTDTKDDTKEDDKKESTVDNKKVVDVNEDKKSDEDKKGLDINENNEDVDINDIRERRAQKKKQEEEAVQKAVEEQQRAAEEAAAAEAEASEQDKEAQQESGKDTKNGKKSGGKKK